MSHGPLQVAFWSLLLGFGLSAAVSITSPESIRLALNTSPSAAPGQPATQLAEVAAPTTPDQSATLPVIAAEPSPRPVAVPSRGDDEPVFNNFAVMPSPDRNVDRQPPADPMPGAVPDSSPMPVVSIASAPDIPVVTTESMRTVREPRFEELPPPPMLVADRDTDESSSPERSVDEFEMLQTQIEQLRSDLERMTSARVDEQLADLRRVQSLLEQMHGTEQIQSVEQEVDELRETFRELRSELEAATARANGAGETGAAGRDQKPPLRIVPSANQPGQVTVEANSVPVADVLRELARHAGRNVVCAADVGGPVTVHFDSIDPAMAIRMIASTQRLHLRDQDGLWHVDGAPAAHEIAAEMERTAAARSQRLFRLRHLDPPAAARLIRPLLSETGQISHQEERTDSRGATRRTGLENALLVVDDVDRIAAIESLIEELDHPPQMVEIQATIFEVVTDSQDQACVLTLLADDSAPACRDPYQCAAKGGHCTCDLTHVVQPPAGGLVTEVRCRSPRQIEHALSRFGEVRTVAMPHVQVADRARAELVVGEQVLLHAAGPDAKRTSTIVPGGVFLAVRPVLSDDGLIRLEVHPRLGAGAVTTAGHAVPTGGGLETTVVMAEGCSLVIGGIVDERVATAQEPHRGWSKMPFVGRRVDRQQTRSLRRELLITITPRIVVPGEHQLRPVPAELPQLSEEQPPARPAMPVLELTGATRGGEKRH
ncbi:secretin N-terminal domain-containing protein [Maioricimonas sp. JC845]|uniref:secretin N-terminal domain-containing protein n=1 Tax=Maioricimonas sp. JC845 TaxID=3232138 RepID=UPI003459D035